jgi:hypothetical protein
VERVSGRGRRDRLEGPDPVLGDDGLPQPPLPVPRWFVAVIAASAIASVVLAALVLGGAT